MDNQNHNKNERSRNEKKGKTYNVIRNKLKLLTGLKVANKILLLILITTVVVIGYKIWEREQIKAEITAISTIEKMIDISELYTFQAVYNGIAEVENKNKADKIDYYVSYEAKLQAGFDFEELKVEVDNKNEIIRITIPEISIMHVNVDYASMEFMFQNDKTNKSAVTGEAYNVCIDDATNESAKIDPIFKLAEENARNVITALVNPFINQMDRKYKLDINFGGV